MNVASAVSEALRASTRSMREFFTLAEAERRAPSVPREVREGLAATLPVADQRLRAADMLFTQGGWAEGLRLAEQAYRSLRTFADDQTGFVASSALSELERALESRLPALDEEVLSEHRALFERLVSGYRELRHELAPLALDDDARAATRKRRTRVAVGLAIAVLGLGLALSRRKTVNVEASASYGGRYLAENAADGLDHTHWILPDKTLGWIDFKLSPPRKVEVVSILNGFEPPSYGVIDFRLEAWVGNKVVKTHDATFAGQPAYTKPDVADVPFAVDQKVDKIRLVVKSHREMGASLAEVVIH